MSILRRLYARLSPSKAPSWEFRQDKEMYSLLIGNYLGPDPEKRVAEVRDLKRKSALLISEQTRMNENDTVLEIGSGPGYQSAHIAPQVKRLYCCDISASFLKVAQRECSRLDNVSFHLLKPYSFRFDFLPDSTMDAVFACSVFFHLDLFGIFWYFQEIARVTKPGGRVWMDMADAESLDPSTNPIFLEMANYYRQGNMGAYPMLLKWHSVSAIQAIAKSSGFACDQVTNGRSFTTGEELPNTKYLLFVKK